MITKSMLQEGYRKSLVELIESPNGDGVVCQIGKMWFYFGGHKAEEMSVEEYKRDIPEETIIDELIEVLDEFRTDLMLKNEYAYYESYLRCNNVNGEDLDFWLEKNIETHMMYAVSKEYAKHLLEYKDGWTGISILKEIKEDVKEASAYKQGFWSKDDIALALGRVLMRRLGIEV